MDTSESRRASVPPSTPRFHQVFRRMNDPHVFMNELLSRHGDVMRWRAFFDVYLLNHPDHVRRILAQEHERFSKNTIDYRVLTRLMGHGLVTSEGAHWAKQRKLIQPMFSSRNVNRFDEVINALTRGLLADWDRRTASEPLWIDREMNRLAFQVASETLFGGDGDRYADEMAAILEVVNVQPQDLQGLMTLLPWIPTPYNLKWRRAMKRLNEIVHGMIAERRRELPGRENVLDLLIQARDPDTGQAMSDTQIRDEVVTLLLAGHETSATALAWTLYLLGTHPDVEQHLSDVLNSELGGEAALAGDLARVPYLKQVVQESMRLYPPVWAVARRSERAQVFDGYSVPAQAYIGIVAYALHRHPEFWPDPERFDPERFAPGAGRGRHSYAYLPFAAGPRTCIGAGMAMLEIQLVLAQLLQRFRVRPIPGYPGGTVAKVTLKPKHGLPMQVYRA